MTNETPPPALAGERIESIDPVISEPLRPLTLDEFLSLEAKPRAMLLAPILQERGLAMLYAPRGVGKTNLALSMAYAVASGSSVLKWTASQAKRVLYIDGEMPMDHLQDRLWKIMSAAAEGAHSENFKILAADCFDYGLPNLATREGQKAVQSSLEGVDLVVIDNLSTLATTGRENEADSWTPVQDWLLRLRRRGTAVLLVHHAGKAGQQRGTSRSEDILDTVIALKRPHDYNQTQGARFIVELEKARGLCGEGAKSFEARLETLNDGFTWSMREIADANYERVKELLNDSLSVREISKATGIPKSTVDRLKRRLEADHLDLQKAA